MIEHNMPYLADDKQFSHFDLDMSIFPLLTFVKAKREASEMNKDQNGRIISISSFDRIMKNILSD